MALSSAAAVGANPWARILDRLEKRVSRSSYDTWLRPTRFSHARGDIVVVRVPTAEFRHLGDKYGDLIQEAIELLALDVKDVEFVTADEDPSTARPESGFPAVSAQGRPVQSRFDWDSAAQLSPRYTFDAFVTGAGNQFAQAAALAVAERPSKAYNPLFLYGGVGMGKTHLMQAIGHEIKKRQPETSICYVTSE
ncbi:MAG: DnaA ATPase domain-containing protein, partial [Terriglobales bacterium]